MLSVVIVIRLKRQFQQDPHNISFNKTSLLNDLQIMMQYLHDMMKFVPQNSYKDSSSISIKTISHRSTVFALRVVILLRAKNNIFVFRQTSKWCKPRSGTAEHLHCLPLTHRLSNPLHYIRSILLHQGPVTQSVVSLTSLLRVISLTVLTDSVYNILIFFAEKCE